MSDQGIIISICSSRDKHVAKTPVVQGYLREGVGLEGDSHAVGGDRQVSFLAKEAIDKIKQDKSDITSGMFGENIVVEGIDFKVMKKETRLQIGEQAVVEITQIGKECHSPCSIYKEVGYCIMPEQGLFAKVICSGAITAGDHVKLI
ncbi:MAG: MOSC domain-containing protein [Candidatus Aceula meridiana]|nr:MOSC domain-containing protein [Candidatus Aceula meridiana]